MTLDERPRALPLVESGVPSPMQRKLWFAKTSQR